MSEERVIRINKVLRELNISLDRAVDFLKDKGHEIESSPNAKISQEEYKVLCGQFSADKGNKVASLEVSEEKRKEKEALKRELEKEQESKRLQEEERQRQEIIKAKAVVTAPKSVGKIELDSKKQVASETPTKESKEEVGAAKPATKTIKEVKVTNEKVVIQKTEPKKPAAEEPSDEAEEEKIETQYHKLSGATFTGQKIDLAQFDKAKKKKEDFKKIQGNFRTIDHTHSKFSINISGVDFVFIDESNHEIIEEPKTDGPVKIKKTNFHYVILSRISAWLRMSSIVGIEHRVEQHSWY